MLHPRVAVAFGVDHEARFLSHHDMMRLFEHAAVRAKLPLRYSEGFNPRPRLSLPLPRPTGVASRCELLVLHLTEPVEPDRVAAALSAAVPEGVTVLGGRDLPAQGAPHARRATFELPVPPPRRGPVAERLEQLQRESRWPIRREARGRQPAGPIDLRPLVAAIALDGERLRFTLVADGQRWARPAEVLALAGLDSPAARSRLVRTVIHWD